MEDIKNQEMEQENSNNEEKTFTQDEVNRIVQERLSRNKSKNDELEEREKKIIQRELKADCKDILIEKNLPVELSELFNGYSEDELDKFIDVIGKIEDKIKSSNENKMRGHKPNIGNTVEYNSNDPIKEAFRLFKWNIKRRGKQWLLI